MKIKKIVNALIMRIRGQITTDTLIKRGMTIGTNFSRRNNVQIDASHAYMITIGNHVTLAGGVNILAHDASTKMFLGYTKIAPVKIGDNVFVGQNTIILPGVTIGNNVIIGAGSVVTKNIPSGTVIAGNPAKIIKSTEEYLEKNKKALSENPILNEDYIGKLSINKIKDIKGKINKIGFIV